MKKPRLITVTGHRTNTLRQMLSHYKDMVSEIHLVNYRTLDVDNKESFDRVNEIAEEFGCIVHEREADVFNWISVTHFYNEIKNLYPEAKDADVEKLVASATDYADALTQLIKNKKVKN
jgi:predicted RNA-binding protein with EMAP domain